MDRHALQAIYGNEETILSAQVARYADARRQFVALYGAQPEAMLRTPGRINLIGEHTDYNGGFVLPVALDRDVLCLARLRHDQTVRATNAEPQFEAFSFSLSTDIPQAPRGHWSNYFRGAAQEICRRFGDTISLRGMDVYISGSAPHGVPRGAGLSSSTALTVTAALALITLNQIELFRPDLASMCSEAEWYVGTRGGMMDQFSALLCRRDHALYLDCRPTPDGRYTYDHVPIPAGVQIALLNSGIRHENVRGTFNQRVAECKIGVRLLQQEHPTISHLRDVTPQALGLSECDFWRYLQERLPVKAAARALVELGVDRDWIQELIADHQLDPDARFSVLPRCRHVITENERVLAGITALRAGQVETFGALMNAAHASMSEDYQASCPEVDLLAEVTRSEPGVLGARITGAGWGGGVVALVRRDADPGWSRSVAAVYREETDIVPEIVICRPGMGAGTIPPQL